MTTSQSQISFTYMNPNNNRSNSSNSMYKTANQQKQVESSDYLSMVKHKLSILAHATKRLHHQHENLLELNSPQFHNNALPKFYSFSENVQIINSKLDKLNSRINNWNTNSKSVHSSSGKKSAKITRLRQRINKIKLQVQSKKNNLKKPSICHHSAIQDKFQAEINQINKNVRKVLSINIEKIQNVRTEKKAKKLGALIQRQTKQKMNDIESNLGLLICEVIYEQSRKKSGEEKQIIDKYNKMISQNTDNGSYEEVRDYLNGCIQAQIIEKEYNDFSKTAMERLSYNSLLIREKMQIMEKCLLAQLKNRQLHSKHLCYNPKYQTDKKLQLSQQNNKRIKTFQSSKKFCLEDFQQYEQQNQRLLSDHQKIQIFQKFYKDLQIERKGMVLGQDLLRDKHQRLQKKLQIIEQKQNEIKKSGIKMFKSFNTIAIEQKQEELSQILDQHRHILHKLKSIKNDLLLNNVQHY